jgi:hypothetical protein
MGLLGELAECDGIDPERCELLVRTTHEVAADSLPRWSEWTVSDSIWPIWGPVSITVQPEAGRPNR